MEQFLLNLLKTSLLGALAILLMLVSKPLGVERGDKAAERPTVEPLQNAAAFKLEVFVS